MSNVVTVWVFGFFRETYLWWRLPPEKVLSKPCLKRSDWRGRGFELIRYGCGQAAFLTIKYANLWRPCCRRRRGCVSSLLCSLLLLTQFPQLAYLLIISHCPVCWQIFYFPPSLAPGIRTWSCLLMLYQLKWRNLRWNWVLTLITPWWIMWSLVLEIAFILALMLRQFCQGQLRQTCFLPFFSPM